MCTRGFVPCLGETLANPPSSLCSPDLWLSSEPHGKEIFVCLWSFWEPQVCFPPSSLLPTLEVPEHKRESFLLELPAMVGRSSARNTQEKSAPDLPSTALQSGGMEKS